MLSEQIKKYYDKKYDLNCAEAIMYAANEEYDLNLNKQTLKTMSAFGGGMGIESVCGAITGALAVLGIMFTKERAHESDRIKRLDVEFFNTFVEELGTMDCKVLKQKYRNDDMRCSLMVDKAAMILDKMVQRERVLDKDH